MSSSTAYGSGQVGKDASTRPRTPGDESRGNNGLPEMREDLSRLAGVVAHVAEHRVSRARVKTQVAMRENPWATVGIAAAVGCLAAVLIAPLTRSSGRRSRSQNFDFSDLGRYIQMPSMPQFTMPHVNTKPITSRLEQVVDQVSRMDAQTAGPAIEKIKDWFDAAMSRIRK